MPLTEISTGATLHYEHLNPAASGIPVIVIHGLLGTARSQLGDLLDWLADNGYPTIGLTLRGYGESLPKPRDFPDNFYHRDAEDVLAFMDALNIKKAHFLGYSDGGEVVLIMAGKYPDRVASTAAWGAVGNFGAELRPVFQRTHPGSRWITSEEMDEHGLTDPDAFTLQWVRSTTRMIDEGGDISLSMAGNITSPTMILLGKDDTLNPAEYAQRFLDKTSDGKLALFDCGHPVHGEQRDAFYAVIKGHLERANAKATS
ncbi:MAG: alpha/beta fold hydrolase [Aggregatilineales bacterium]